MKWGVLLIVGFLFLPSVAGAETTPVGSQRDSQLLRWIRRSKLPTPPVTVTVEDHDCFPAGSSCTFPGTTTIYLNPDDGRQVFMHELGHQFDYAVMSDADREKFLELHKLDREWRSPPNSPNEQFASVYAWLATHGKRTHPGKRLAYLARVRDPVADMRLIRHVMDG